MMAQTAVPRGERDYQHEVNGEAAVPGRADHDRRTHATLIRTQLFIALVDLREVVLHDEPPNRLAQRNAAVVSLGDRRQLVRQPGGGPEHHSDVRR
jgi:hypothetical protein